jgi:hypothetical protein
MCAVLQVLAVVAASPNELRLAPSRIRSSSYWNEPQLYDEDSSASLARNRFAGLGEPNMHVGRQIDGDRFRMRAEFVP